MTTAAQTATITAVSKRRFPRPGRMALHTVIAVILFFWLLPTVGMLVNSLRPAAAVSSSGWWTVFTNPQSTTENYTHVLNQNGISSAFVNSLLITFPSVVISVAVAAFAAFAFAWMNFRGREVLFILVVALLVVPLQSTLVPVLRLFRDLGVAEHTARPLPGRLAGPHRLRPSVRRLPAPQLHGRSAEGDHGVGRHRRCRHGREVLPAGRADVRVLRSPRW